VITLDVEMPRMDGISFLKRLMAQRPIPVVMCSSLVGESTTTLSEALAAGAVGIICKPKFGVKGFLEDARVEICETIKGAAKARLRPAKSLPVTPKLTADAVLPPASGRAMSRTTEVVVAIGASTGGTEALRFLLDALPPACRRS
jgi:two-component system chemotaxis response regulator CheB